MDKRLLEDTLNLVYTIARTINTYEDMGEALRDIIEKIGKALHSERAYLLVKDPVSNMLLGRYGFNVSYEELSRLVYTIGEGVVGKAYKSGKFTYIPDISKNPYIMRKLRGGNKAYDVGLSFVCVPIKYKRKSVGIMGVEFRSKDMRFSVNELDYLLKMVADIIGGAVYTYSKLRAENEYLRSENIRLKAELKISYQFKNIVAVSKPMQRILRDIRKLADTDVTVLFRGESGTGKEVLAKALHYNSKRRNKPFVAINCAAIPENLVESELFGYERGAFTGATSLKKGKFEIANGGTIFLDEVGDMPINIQAKLLRVLQDKEITRLGGNSPIKVNVRIVAATNRNLEEMVANGDFREDLADRLSVVTIYLPPLRERKEDIPVLVEHILRRFSYEFGRELSITKSALDLLMQCYWIGNVRQLENCLERAVVLADNDELIPENFPCHTGEPCLLASVKPKEITSPKPFFGFYKRRKEEEKEIIETALKKVGYCQAKAARLLGITPRQIHYRIKKYNISIPKI